MPFRIGAVCPVPEGSVTIIGTCDDGVRDAGPAIEQSSYQPVKPGVGDGIFPTPWNCINDIVEKFFLHRLDTRQPWFAIGNSAQSIVEPCLMMDSRERRLPEQPVNATERESAINHERLKSGAASLVLHVCVWGEDCLRLISIADPMIESQRTDKVGAIRDPREESVRQHVVNSSGVRMARVARPKVNAWVDCDPCFSLQINLGVIAEEFRRNVNKRSLRCLYPEILHQLCGHPFVDENTPMLGVIYKFGNITIAVVPFDKVRLRAAAHFPDKSTGINHCRPLNRIVAGRHSRTVFASSFQLSEC